ncbi:MAG: DUF2842 domain-containing protein [Pseudomonadota bacterium]
MNVRVKKLIGTVITIIFVTIYCLLVMQLAVRILPGSNGWIQTVFYTFFGLIWILPLMALIKWMHAEPR